MYQPTSSWAISVYSKCPFVVSSFDSGSNESYDDEQFDFSIDNELLLDPNDIVMGEMIGEGGSSIVYKGLFKDRIPVAVKIVQPSRTAAVSVHQKERFQKEVLLLSKMKHDNIVKFVGACIEPQLMIVTELLEGGTLQKFLWNTRPCPLDLKMSLSFALDISRAMEFLHSNGIIHRDLKPRNVLVTSDMKQVKLADLGLAREESTGCMTSEAGTYRYMAPEVYSREPLKIGEKIHYDHKVDVYSFALLFWELLINKKPFDGVPNICTAYLSSKNVRPSLTNVPDGAVFILKSCWAEDSKARPEFKEITVLLTNLRNSLCSGSSFAATTSSEEADPHGIEDPKRKLIQECNSHVMEAKEEEKKNKSKKNTKKNNKVVTLMLPVFKMFKACLYKP